MSIYSIVPCHPDDALFDAVLSDIYPNGAFPKNEVDEDHYRQCLVVMSGEEVYGRIVVYQNSAIKYHGKSTVQFGNFECRDDADASYELIDAAMKLSRSLGAEFVIGPMNGSTWNQYRFITERGDRRPFITEQNHPAYYPEHWLDAGFKEIQEYVSNLVPIYNNPNFRHFF